MSKISVKNVEGAEVEQAELSDAVYGIEPNIPVIHQIVVAQDSNMRQGTHSVKNRHEVSGGGRKPYRQKGTGRARQGSIRAAQWRGGGVVFGPTRDLNQEGQGRPSRPGHHRQHARDRRCRRREHQRLPVVP